MLKHQRNGEVSNTESVCHCNHFIKSKEGIKTYTDARSRRKDNPCSTTVVTRELFPARSSSCMVRYLLCITSVLFTTVRIRGLFFSKTICSNTSHVRRRLTMLQIRDPMHQAGTDLSYDVTIRSMLISQVKVSDVAHRLKSRRNGHPRRQHFFQDLASPEKHQNPASRLTSWKTKNIRNENIQTMTRTHQRRKGQKIISLRILQQSHSHKVPFGKPSHFQ